MTKKEALEVLKKAKETKKIYYSKLRDCQQILTRKKVNDFVKNNDIKIIIKL